MAALYDAIRSSSQEKRAHLLALHQIRLLLIQHFFSVCVYAVEPKLTVPPAPFFFFFFLHLYLLYLQVKILSRVHCGEPSSPKF